MIEEVIKAKEPKLVIPILKEAKMDDNIVTTVEANRHSAYKAADEDVIPPGLLVKLSTEGRS